MSLGEHSSSHQAITIWVKAAKKDIDIKASNSDKVQMNTDEIEYYICKKR